MEQITSIETEWDKRDIETELQEEAQPGRLPFDLFAIVVFPLRAFKIQR